MSKNWDYSQLTKLASANGGPRALLKKIVIYGYEEGVAAMKPVTLLVGVGALAIGSACTFIGTKHFMNKKHLLERTISEEEAEKAIQRLEYEITKLQHERDKYKDTYELELEKNDKLVQELENYLGDELRV